MRRTTILMAAILIPAATAAPAAAQPADPAELAERIQAQAIEAEATDDEAALREAAALAERALAVHPGDPWLLHYHGYALYRLAARHACDEIADPRCVGDLLERAESALQASLAARPIPETYALLGSVHGLQIGENPALGASLGNRIDELQGQALAMDPENPRVWLLKGIGDLYTPAAFGGGPAAALASLERAARAFETDRPEPPAPRWGKADVHVWMERARGMMGGEHE